MISTEPRYNRVKSVGESGLYSRTGDAVLDYFKTAKKEAEEKAHHRKFISLMARGITLSGSPAVLN